MKYQQTLILGGIYLLLMLAAGYIHNFIGALIAWASLGLFAFFSGLFVIQPSDYLFTKSIIRTSGC